MYKEDDQYPKNFAIEYKVPGWNKFVNFTVYREPDRYSWNGYYRNARIRLFFTGDYWVVTAGRSGIEGCYFRMKEERPELKKINDLVQCACYYIDITNTNNNDKNNY